MPLEKLGPYKLEKLLGRGGMGAVYAGLHEQPASGRRSKCFRAIWPTIRTFRERFKQEIETLKRLLHPNIVQLFGFGEEDGHLYYVMELVEGRTLQDELTAGRRFDLAGSGPDRHRHCPGPQARPRPRHHSSRPQAGQPADRRQDHVKLTDFGIAKLYGGTSVTAEGGVLGTADYMAPEQAERQAGHQPLRSCMPWAACCMRC